MEATNISHSRTGVQVTRELPHTLAEVERRRQVMSTCRITLADVRAGLRRSGRALARHHRRMLRKHWPKPAAGAKA